MTNDAVPPARPLEQRKRDTLELLRTETDLWIASVSENGRPHLVPLSHLWDGAALVVAAPRASRTARNLLRSGRARVAVGSTRDVVLVDGAVDAVEIGVDSELEDAHARATGFDPRTLPEEYVYLRLTPETVQAWREENELAGRYLMRGGHWLA